MLRVYRGKHIVARLLQTHGGESLPRFHRIGAPCIEHRYAPQTQPQQTSDLRAPSAGGGSIRTPAEWFTAVNHSFASFLSESSPATNAVGQPHGQHQVLFSTLLVYRGKPAQRGGTLARNRPLPQFPGLFACRVAGISMGLECSILSALSSLSANTVDGGRSQGAVVSPQRH